MRKLWIASGLGFVLLTLAVVLRPAQVVEPTASDPIAPRPLSADDLSQIMALRAQFGSPSDHFGGPEASPAAFEEQLRQVAGLDEKKAVFAADSDSASKAVLRRASAELDALANQSEEAGRFPEADDLRSLAGQVRRLARVASHSAQRLD
jgi:hypothetical protein